MDGKAQAITDNIPDNAHIADITHTNTHQHIHIHSRHWQSEIILSVFLSGKANTLYLKSI